jgi:hypothetical protein
MLQRAITPQEVEAVLGKPERLEPSVKERQNAFGLGGHGTIRIPFRETADEILVITVVRQSTSGGTAPVKIALEEGGQMAYGIAYVRRLSGGGYP